MFTLLCLAALAGCGGGDNTQITKVFSGPTWDVGEQLAYQLRQRDEISGTCTLSVENAEDPALQRLVSLCGSPDGRYRDDRWVEVDPATLTPIESERVIADLDDESRTVFNAAYGSTTVLFTAAADGNENETTRDLPEPNETSPDPGYYDDVALFWVIRGAPLAEGYEASFINSNAGNARTFTVSITVQGSETVAVPAGEFETWEVEVKTGSITQIVWIEKDAARRVIRARIEREFYELLPTDEP